MRKIKPMEEACLVPGGLEGIRGVVCYSDYQSLQ